MKNSVRNINKWRWQAKNKGVKIKGSDPFLQDPFLHNLTNEHEDFSISVHSYFNNLG